MSNVKYYSLLSNSQYQLYQVLRMNRLHMIWSDPPNNRRELYRQSSAGLVLTWECLLCWLWLCLRRQASSSDCSFMLSDDSQAQAAQSASHCWSLIAHHPSHSNPQLSHISRGRQENSLCRFNCRDVTILSINSVSVDCITAFLCLRVPAAPISASVP